MAPFSLQALLHASVACHKKLVIEWVAASDLEEITAQEVSLVFISLRVRQMYLVSWAFV